MTGIAGMALAASLVTAGSVHAASWWSDPNSCSGAATAVSRVVSGRTVQVRYGTCGGVQHGWGRILNYASSDGIRFEVDLNGDRSADAWSFYRAGTRNYTSGYPTSSSADRAFRACYESGSTKSCTAWW
ncbi:hypothetical protein ABGB17_14695 [Sphaerisporangium sp. B11E5]|uniref:hypothetical protein n=1 Tax=Sphaerisporangium sp. B11E5 TaxID=3153563 RepID=UPI00325E54BA